MTRLLIAASPRVATQVAAGNFLNARAELPIVTDLSMTCKSPRSSFLRLALPLSSDAALRTRFVNAAGFVRVGRLLEELDAFAGAIALLHCDDGDASRAMPSVVTAAFDRVDLLRSVRANEDLEFAGAVTHAGRSSLNIDVELTTASGELVFTAATTFVARVAADKGVAVPVPRLVAITPADAALAAIGERAANERKARAASSFFRVPPTADELSVLHDLFLESSGASEGGGGDSWVRAPPMSMSHTAHHHQHQQQQQQQQQHVTFTDETRVSSTIVTMPEDRNIYGKMFGGYLLKAAYEIAWSCGWRATGVAPQFLALDAVTFRAPVDVGTLLRMDAQIAFADDDRISITVDATMSVPGRAGPGETPTNQFSFVFKVPRIEGEAEVPPQKFAPRTYAEGLSLLAARRRALAHKPPHVVIHETQEGLQCSRFPSEWRGNQRR